LCCRRRGRCCGALGSRSRARKRRRIEEQE
jgi:hypothetical protein